MISKIFFNCILSIFLLFIPLKAKGLTVQSIIFEGNFHASENVLQNIIKTRKNKSFDNKLLRFDRILLTNYYHQKGFLDVWIEPGIKRRGENLEVIYRVNEGKQFLLGGIQVTGGKLVSNADLRKNFTTRDGQIFNRQAIENGLNIIEDWYYNHGKPYVNLIEKEIKKDSIIFVDLTVKENELVHIGVIQYVGLNKVREYVVRRELEVRLGDLYSRKKIEESQKNIYSTGLFNFVGLELQTMDTSRTKARLLVKVVEKKSRWVGFKLGVAYEQETVYGGSFDFTTEFGHRNLFGTARTIFLNIIPSLSYDFNKNDFVNPKNQFSLTYVEPWIGFTRTPGILQIAYYQVRPLHSADYDYFTSSFMARHRFSDSRELSATLTFDRVKILENDTLGQSYFSQTQGQDFIYSVSSSYVRDSRDNYLNPQYGSVTNATVKFAYSKSRDQNTRAITINRFLKFDVTWNRYQRFPLKRNWILASRLRTGTIAELGRRTIVPRTERFYLGGASTVRGYPEQLLGPVSYEEKTGRMQAIGGKLVVLANLELRIPLFWLLWGEVFLDGGNVFLQKEDFKLNSIKTSSGFGLAVITPFGPVRFDYGLKLRPEKNESKREFHIGISFAF